MIGYRLAQLLEKQQRAGLSVKIIERDPLTCERLSQALRHTLVLNGDATRPEVLDEENIDKVDAFVVTVGNDATNLLTGFMAKQRGATRVIAELDSDSYVTVAAQMGIDATVVPRMIVASTILRLVRKSNVVSLRNRSSASGCPPRWSSAPWCAAMRSSSPAAIRSSRKATMRWSSLPPPPPPG